MDGWKTILSFPFRNANVQFGLLLLNFRGLGVSSTQRRISGESTYVTYHPGNLEMSSIVGVAPSKRRPKLQAKQWLFWVLGSYPHGFFVLASFWKGFFFPGVFFSDLQEGLRLVKDVDIDQPFSMQDGDFTLSKRFRETKYEVNK